MGQFRDYFLYCESLRNALKQRDIQQVEYEELTSSLEQKLSEREAATNPQASKSWISSITGPADPQKLQENIDEVCLSFSCLLLCFLFSFLHIIFCLFWLLASKSC